MAEGSFDVGAPGAAPEKAAAPVPAAPALPEPTAPIVQVPQVAQVVPTAPAVPRVCGSCGARIVGKARSRCPACRAALDASIADLLCFSEAAWVRSLAFGALVMALAIAAHLAAAALVWTNKGLIGQTLHVIAGILMAAGAWIITREETGGAPQRRPAIALIGRWSAIAVAALWALLLIVFTAKRSGSMHPLTAMTLGVMVIEALMLGVFLHGLAARLPHEGLATQFGNLAGIMPAILSGLIVAQFIDITPVLLPLFFCLYPLLGGLCGLVLWAAVTMLRMALELYRCAGTARHGAKLALPVAG